MRADERQLKARKPGARLTAYPATKKCARCKETYPADAFPKRHGGSGFRLDPYCPTCLKERNREKYARLREKNLASQAAWRAKQRVARGLPPEPRAIIPPSDRFAKKYRVAESGCWEWLGGTNGHGYGTFMVAKRLPRAYAHRYSYELHVGPIPAGLQIDHLCRNRSCVNPAHLEVVTCLENLMRSEHPHFKTARTGVCQRGHDMSDAYVGPNGHRRCRECARANQRAYALRRRAVRTVPTYSDKPRKPLPAVSNKRAKENRERSKALRDTFGQHPLCARCGRRADDAHELLSRARGGSIVDPANIAPLCRQDHRWVTENPAEAAAEGWVLSAGDAR